MCSSLFASGLWCDVTSSFKLLLTDLSSTSNQETEWHLPPFGCSVETFSYSKREKGLRLEDYIEDISNKWSLSTMCSSSCLLLAHSFTCVGVMVRCYPWVLGVLPQDTGLEKGMAGEGSIPVESLGLWRPGQQSSFCRCHSSLTGPFSAFSHVALSCISSSEQYRKWCAPQCLISGM